MPSTDETQVQYETSLIGSLLMDIKLIDVILLYAEGIIFAVVRNHFLEYNSAKTEPTEDEILHGDVGSGGTLPHKRLASSAKQAQYDGEKTPPSGSLTG